MLLTLIDTALRLVAGWPINLITGLVVVPTLHLALLTNIQSHGDSFQTSLVPKTRRPAQRIKTGVGDISF